MPRPPRIQFEDASYHAFSRGNRRAVLFRSEADYQTFETYMLEAMRRSGIKLFNWNLLPNHFHFNLATPEGHLADFMQRLLTRYAKYFNFTYRLVGHLFQGRYGAKLVDRDAYFKEIIRYVELNSYRVRGQPLAPLGKWRWSSLHYLLQPEEAWPEGCRSSFREVLETFSSDATRSRTLLLQFLADGLESGTWEDFYRPKDGRFIGDPAFVERVKAAQGEPVRQARRIIEGRHRLEDLVPIVLTAGALLLPQLRAPGKERRLSRWRQALVWVARRYLRIPVVQLSKLLGRRESAISMIVKRFHAQADQWTETQQILQKLSESRNKCEL